ncbi:MAG TPA: GGDEF domain-containing protein [Steroidobacteraceae bacterium]
MKARVIPGTLLACLLVAAAATAGAAATATDPAALLTLADGLKLADHARFESIIDSLDRRLSELTPEQRAYLQFLHGWDAIYRGDYPAAIATLSQIPEQEGSETVRFRADATLVNLFGIVGRYKEAYTRVERMIDVLPDITDQAARQQSMLVAGLLYEQVGQYDLSLAYARRVMRENWGAVGVCKGGMIEIEALYHSGKLQTGDPELGKVIDACIRERQPMFAEWIETYAARADFDHGEVKDGLTALLAYNDEVQRTRYSRLISEYDALLAQGNLQTHESAAATHFARAAIAASGAGVEFSQPLAGAYDVLYRLARSRGDYRTALQLHEHYATAEIAYLNDRAARGSAYAEVRRQVATRRLEIQSLSRKNRLLELEHRLAAKQVEATRLYGVILTLILIFIGLWAILTKRSQLHFKSLSRLDGLTGIANRLHFIERAEAALGYARKSEQDVCLLLFDLDHFKSINDRFGHATGDFVLKRTATLCSAYLRRSDTFGRFGGEEFSVLLPGCRLEEAREQAEQLRRAISAIREEQRGAALTVSASFGIASSTTSGYDLQRLMAHADAALYRAKRSGRNCVVAYDPAESGEVRTITPSLKPDGSPS